MSMIHIPTTHDIHALQQGAYSGRVAIPPIFKGGSLGGIEPLWDEKLLTIGASENPMLWFDGTGLDNVAKTWTCRQTGEVLVEAGAGASPDLAALGIVASEMAAQFFAAKYLVAGNNIFGAITTEDVVLELVMSAGTVGSGMALNKGPVGGVGYEVYRQSAATQRFIQDAGAAIDTNTSGASFSEYAFTHAMHFTKRGSFGQWYVAGVASGAADALSADTSWDVAAPFSIGARSGGAFANTNCIALIAIWKRASWLDTHLQAVLAKRRAALCMGMIAALNTGGSTTPTVL